MSLRVLLDGSKLLDLRTDGIKRYVHELVRAMAVCQAWDRDSLQVDVALGTACIVPLPVLAEKLETGDLLAKFVPRLLSPGADNPLLACQARLENRGSAWHVRGRDQIELQAWRLARSGVRKWLRWKRRWPVRPGEYDLVHLTLPNTWRQYTQTKSRLLTTVHDLSHLACPELQTRSNNLSLTEGLAFARRRDSRFAAVSQATANELTSRLAISPSAIDVTLEGVDHTRFRANASPADWRRVRDRYRLPDGDFFFCLGTIEPRKNLLNTVRGFQRMTQTSGPTTARLLIAGKPGWGAQQELEHLVASHPQIEAIGYVREDDLPVLYARCLAFCYVSRYEGFGLPVLEAMSCGAPVIYGRNSSLPEVAGGGGIGVSAEDPAAIGAAMHRLATDRTARRELAKRAERQAAQFDWQHTAATTLASYERCLATESVTCPPSFRRERARAQAA
jgi:glycosyltransferase involved in cell wall biosynthesis